VFRPHIITKDKEGALMFVLFEAAKGLMGSVY
jgi:hypothetical protein